MCVHCKNKVIIVFLMCCLLFSSCKPDKDDNEVYIPKTVVKTVKVTLKKLNEDLNSFGTISYKTKNDVTVQVQGIITNLYVKEGDYVRKNQTMALLRNVQLEIQREQAVNTLESAKVSLFQAEAQLQEQRLNVESRILSLDKSRLSLEQLKLELQDALENLNNKKELLAVGGITESAYKSQELAVSSKQTDIAMKEKEIEISMLGLRDEDLIANGYEVSDDPAEKLAQLIDFNTRTAQSQIEAAQANVSNAEKNLDSIDRLVEELTIKAPVSGIVGARYFENGEFVPENEKLLTLIDINEVNAVFSIQEQDIQYFEIGNSLTVELPSMSKSFATHISEISPIADATSGNFTVKASFSNPDGTVKPGMFVKCTVARNANSVYPCIPETTILEKDGVTASIFTVVNGFAVLRSIVVKSQKDGYIWIESGIKEDDIVIDKPSPFLKEGESVENR